MSLEYIAPWNPLVDNSLLLVIIGYIMNGSPCFETNILQLKCYANFWKLNDL